MAWPPRFAGELCRDVGMLTIGGLLDKEGQVGVWSPFHTGIRPTRARCENLRATAPGGDITRRRFATYTPGACCTPLPKVIRGRSYLDAWGENFSRPGQRVGWAFCLAEITLKGLTRSERYRIRPVWARCGWLSVAVDIHVWFKNATRSLAQRDQALIIARSGDGIATEGGRKQYRLWAGETTPLTESVLIFSRLRPLNKRSLPVHLGVIMIS